MNKKLEIGDVVLIKAKIFSEPILRYKGHIKYEILINNFYDDIIIDEKDIIKMEDKNE